MCSLRERPPENPCPPAKIAASGAAVTCVPVRRVDSIGAFLDPKPFTKSKVYSLITCLGEDGIRPRLSARSGSAIAKIVYELVIRIFSETRRNRTTGECV